MCNGVLPPDLHLLSSLILSLLHSSSSRRFRNESSSAALTSGLARELSNSSVIATPSGPGIADAICNGARPPLFSGRVVTVDAPKHSKNKNIKAKTEYFSFYATETKGITEDK